MTPLATAGDLVGFLNCETTGEASADDVAPAASLSLSKRVEAFACLGADSDAAHLPGTRDHAAERITIAHNVSRRDTILGMAHILLIETTGGDTIGVRFPTEDDARDWEDAHETEITVRGCVHIETKADALKLCSWS